MAGTASYARAHALTILSMKFLGLSIILATFTAPAASADVPFKGGYPVTSRARIYELRDVKRGDRGVGYTVFSGSKVEPFQFEVLGVMESLIGPSQDIILARLSGKRIEFTGVISGMSGSPVFIDGRLLGAVSYRIGQFTREPIAGITPIRSMLALYGDAVGPRPRVPPPAPPTVLRAPWGADGEVLARYRPAVTDALERFVKRSTEWPSWPVPGRPDTGALRPIDTPISVAGLEPAALSSLRTHLSPAGFRVVAGGARAGRGAQFSVRDPDDRRVEANRASRAGTVDAAPIAPAAPVAIVLMRGAVNASALCTVTMVERDRVYGCGHAFFGSGHVNFPMATAAIFNTLASEAGSFKQSAAAREVGAINQDRLTAVAGELGRAAPMVPVRVTVRRGDQAARGATVTDVEVVDSELWTPVMLESVVGSAVNRRLGFEAGGTLQVKAQVTVGDQTLDLVDTFSAPPPVPLGTFAARQVSSAVGLLLQNAFARATIRGVRVEAIVDPDVAIAEVVGATADRTWVRPGDRLGISVELRPYRGQVERVSVNVPIPRSAGPGPLSVVVGGGLELDRRDNAARGGQVPTSLDQLIALLADRRSSKMLGARVYLPGKGLRDRATVLPGLPPSARVTLRGPPATTVDLEQVPGPEARRPTERVIVGSVELTVEVRE